MGVKGVRGLSEGCQRGCEIGWHLEIFSHNGEVEHLFKAPNQDRYNPNETRREA